MNGFVCLKTNYLAPITAGELQNLIHKCGGVSFKGQKYAIWVPTLALKFQQMKMYPQNEYFLEGTYADKNGRLLDCMHKQQDVFGCLAEILGCPGLREATNLEI